MRRVRTLQRSRIKRCGKLFSLTLAAAFMAGVPSSTGFSQETMGDGFAVDNGDTNGDMKRDLSDGLYLLHYLFAGGPPPVPLTLDAGLYPGVRNGDADADNIIDISDAQYLLNWLFAGGPEPAITWGAPSARVIPVDARPYGSSYAELSRRWWELLLSLRGPDPNERMGDAQESGTVWFLGANPYGETVVRTVTIPADRAIFVPVNIVTELCPLSGETIQDLRDRAAEFMEIEGLELEVAVDGEPLGNLSDFRVQSPVFTVPGGGSVEGISADCVGTEAVSDGTWVLLPPLSIGSHRIEVRSAQPAFEHSVYGPQPAAVGGVTTEIEVARGRD
jgi:hypothetical protein